MPVKVVLIATLPSAPVVRLRKPRNCLPLSMLKWSCCGLRKNSIRTVTPAALAYLPVTCRPVWSIFASEISGELSRPLAPVSVSPSSLAVAPSLPKSMPGLPLA